MMLMLTPPIFLYDFDCGNCYEYLQKYKAVSAAEQSDS